MADNIQLAQDILKIEVNFNPDPLRKLLLDLIGGLRDANEKIDALTKRVEELEP